MKMQAKQAELQAKQADMQLKGKLAAMKLMQEAEVKQAMVMKLQAEATKLLAEANGVDTGHQIALINAQIGAERAHRDSLFRAAETMMKAIELDKKEEMNEVSDNLGGLPGMEKPASNESVPQSPQQQ